ncbi:MAG: hypothetical protein V3T43_06315 [Nitrosomonadaceae bacterium]
MTKPKKQAPRGDKFDHCKECKTRLDKGVCKPCEFKKLCAQCGGKKVKEKCKRCGSPPKYKPKYCEEIIKFFSKPRFYEKVKTQKRWDKHESKWKTVKIKETLMNDLPTFERFAANTGVVVNTLKSWASEYDTFLIALARCKELQKDFLVQMGLPGTYNSSFAIFISTNFTDLENKSVTENTNINKELAKDLTPEEQEDINKSVNAIKLRKPKPNKVTKPRAIKNKAN